MQALDEETRGKPRGRSAPGRAPRPRDLAAAFLLGGCFRRSLRHRPGGEPGIFLLAPRLGSPLLDELVNAHVRSLMPAHLIDVVSTDRHTVKPWFAEHADVSPVVADFEAQGYRLIGGRADYLDHQRSAVVVYQHGAHVINVFSWAGTGRPLPPTRFATAIASCFGDRGDLEYCAVSDTGRDELQGLVRLLQDLRRTRLACRAISRENY